MEKSLEDTLVECNTCGAKIAHNSDKCPSCGKVRSIYDRGFKLIMWLPIFILVFGFIIAIGMGFNGDEGWQLGLVMIVGGAYWLYKMAKKAGF